MEQKRSLKVFGNHNLLNMHAAWLVCQQLGIIGQSSLQMPLALLPAPQTLELLAQKDDTIVYRDFAHAPSKVKATIEAVKAQFPNKKLIAVLELHTYSSLNEAFYEGI